MHRLPRTEAKSSFVRMFAPAAFLCSRRLLSVRIRTASRTLLARVYGDDDDDDISSHDMRKISNPELCPSMHQRDHFCTLQKWSRAVDEVIGCTAHGANARRMRSHEVAWFGAETRRNGKILNRPPFSVLTLTLLPSPSHLLFCMHILQNYLRNMFKKRVVGGF